MYLTLLNMLFNKHISHIRPNHLSGYALVPIWPDNRGRTVLAITSIDISSANCIKGYVNINRYPARDVTF